MKKNYYVSGRMSLAAGLCNFMNNIMTGPTRPATVDVAVYGPKLPPNNISSCHSGVFAHRGGLEIIIKCDQTEVRHIYRLLNSKWGIIMKGQSPKCKFNSARTVGGVWGMSRHRRSPDLQELCLQKDT